MPTGTQRIVTGLFLGALGLVACSDGAMSKEEYVEQANEICSEAEGRLGEIDPQSMEELREQVQEVEDTGREVLADLRELEPPEGDADRIDEMLGSFEGVLDRIPDILEAAEAEDLEELEQITTDVQEDVTNFQEIAREYGLDECAEG
jgi:hypothetical protein